MLPVVLAVPRAVMEYWVPHFSVYHTLLLNASCLSASNKPSYGSKKKKKWNPDCALRSSLGVEESSVV